MNKRTQKLLSLFLVLSMVFSMNTFAFGKEAKVDEAEVVLASETQAYTEDSKATFGEKGEISITKVTDPLSWNQTDKGKDLMYTMIHGVPAGKDEYLYNAKKVKVSGNEGIDGFIASASYNVIPVEGGYLLMEYYLTDGGAGRVAGCEGSIPVATYDGRKIAFRKKGKQSKSSKETLAVNVAVVKYENGTATKVPGVTVKSAKIDAKAIKNASVSYGQIPVKVNDVTDHWEYPLLGSATLPTFTFAVKAAGDAKSFNKVLKTALKDKKYPFAIRQIGVNVELIDPDYDRYNPMDKNGNNLISNGTLSGNFPDESFRYWGSQEYGYGIATTNNAGTLKITKVTAKGGALSMEVDTYNGKKWDVAEVTFKAKTDYTFTSGTVGGETVQVLDFPENGNFRYVDTDNKTTLAGNGYKYAYRPGVNDKKMVRQGIFKADSNGFVFSED